MNHKDMQILVSCFLDDEVTEDERNEVAKHLEVCNECREFIEVAQQARKGIREIGEAPITEFFAYRVAHIVKIREEQNDEWLGVEPLARKAFFALIVIVLIMFFYTIIDINSYTINGEQLITESSMDSASTQVLLQSDELSKGDLLYAVVAE